VNKLKVQFPAELECICNGVNSALTPLQMRLSLLENWPVPSALEKVFPELPFYSHIYFSGDLGETHCFTCVIQDTFA
jgi:hypothetical protein